MLVAFLTLGGVSKCSFDPGRVAGGGGWLDEVATEELVFAILSKFPEHIQKRIDRFVADPQVWVVGLLLHYLIR